MPASTRKPDVCLEDEADVVDMAMRARHRAVGSAGR